MKNIFYFLLLLLFVGTTSCNDDASEPSNAKAITNVEFKAFENDGLNVNITAVINENDKTITAVMPPGTDITLLPRITVSPNATFSPTGAQDFSSPVTYTVTAQDGTTVEYMVHVEITPSQREVLIAFYNANPGNTLSWDLEDPDISNWEGVRTRENGDVLELSLFDVNLTTIPVIIAKLSQLQIIYLSSNQITTIPAEIAQLANLYLISLNDNQITSIPPEITQLAKLELLNLSYNQLNALPAEIGQLPKLHNLNLSNNQLTSIPPEIGQLPNLRNLKLSYNQLTSIPPEIGQLPKLYFFYLSSNQLTTIPVEIGQLINLEELNLYNNQLTSIPQEVCDLDTNHGTEIITDEGVTCE